MKNNSAHLLCCFKLCAVFPGSIPQLSVDSNWSYSSDMLNSVQNRRFFCPCDLGIWWWPRKTTGHIFYATYSFVHHFVKPYVCSGSVLVLAATLLWRNSPEPWPNPWPANVFSQDCLPRINVACKIGNVTVPVFRHCQYSCFDVLYRISHLLYKSVRQYCVWQSSVRLFIFSPLELQILSLIDRWRHQRDRHRGDCLIWF